MNKVITLPNLLSVFRILLIPVFVVFYFQTRLQNHYWYAAGTLVLSGFTDILDGVIARKFNMVSEVGKVLDPIADKLTQVAMVVCLCVNHIIIIPMLLLFVIKEGCMLLGALFLYRDGKKPEAAHWWGKLSTVVIYVTVFIIVLSDIYPVIPVFIQVVLMMAATFTMFFSLFSYFKIYQSIRAGDSPAVKKPDGE